MICDIGRLSLFVLPMCERIAPESYCKPTASLQFVGIRKFIVKVVPIPNSLSTSMVPLCASTIAFAKGNPSPIPCLSLENDCDKPLEDVMYILWVDAASIIRYHNLDTRRQLVPRNTNCCTTFCMVKRIFTILSIASFNQSRSQKEKDDPSQTE